MSTDDRIYDQVERVQRSRTQHRRENRSRRKRVYVLIGLGLLAALVIAAPSLISHSSFGRSMVSRAIGDYGLDANVDSMRIGWVTPLRIDGLRVNGDAGSSVSIMQLDVDVTVVDVIRSPLTELGQVTVRGIDVSCSVDNGRCTLEDDLAPLLQPSAQDAGTTATIKLQDITVSVTDAVAGAAWKVSQSNADVDLTLERIQGSFAGVLTGPGGSGGSLQGSAEYLLDPNPQTNSASPQWRLEVNSESLPLSVVSLLRRRFPSSAQSIPSQIHGDATGAVVLVGGSDGAIEASVSQLNVRNFTAADEGSRVWSNRLATLDGELILVGDRVIGRQLQATSDFAAARIDGAFSRSFSLVGVNDNPLRWLEAIDGRATIETDLAALDQSLPGMLPLRDEAELVSGHIVAQVDTAIEGSLRRSKLSIDSDAIRARSGGSAVVIDPIELVATVSSRDGGPLQADQFTWKSAFGNAVGHGDLRSGHADIEVDFGRLTSMLRPIMHISESSLDGIVRGKIDWNAADNDMWKLSGEGSAANLVISMSGGRTLRRPSMQGTIEAIGRWGGDSLAELTAANASLSTTGLDLRGELTAPVRNPASAVAMPVRFVGNGRVDTLLETCGPWLPAELHDGAGSFCATASAEISSETARLSEARINLTDPKIAYGDRYFNQPEIKIDFDGLYSWPSGDLLARNLTVAGDAFSLAAVGNASADQTDMQIKWRAKLERIQGSVRHSLASRQGHSIQPVGFRNDGRLKQVDIGDDQWLVIGDCQGEVHLQTQDGLLSIDTLVDGAHLAIIQPAATSQRYQAVGPSAPMVGQGTTGISPGAQVVWSEPNVKLDGRIRYDQRTGQIAADQMQIAGDWFATTLSGAAIWNDSASEIQLNGPARLKMEQVANRLSQLAGVQIMADGIHETPLDIHFVRNPSGEIAMNIAANIGWERSQIAGLAMGESSIPIVLNETSVTISPATIPVGDHRASMGRLNFAGQVHYRPGPLWMRLERGSSAESLRLTSEMTDKWLKYLAPMAADAARIDGTIGVQLDEALIVFDQPEQSRVAGRLNIAGVEMTSGPLANQIYGGIHQLKNLANSVSGAGTDLSASHSMITMPPQTVDFVVDQGVVQHNRMFFIVDRAEVITSGRVAMDGRLDLIAQVPLDERWLGSDLKGMANQPVTLPIDGTLSRPSLDSTGVRRVVSELGVQAIQQSAENYLQKQIGRGMEKLFGR